MILQDVAATMIPKISMAQNYVKNINIFKSLAPLFQFLGPTDWIK